jgi:hypothetical protein
MEEILLDCTSLKCSDLASSLSECPSGKQQLSFVIKSSCSRALLLTFKISTSFLSSTISFLILLILCYKFEIVTTLVLGLENLSKVSSRDILDLEGLLTSLVMSFLSFLRYSSFNS